ncbi:hypothetical protein FGO68_gene3929 [Halteria grandinella]|uniref:Uncharacterized protein n=1 Tax=Halteria grandinella TaxID=5974 RepID=A0A8J8T7X8_HALGN|nr:hypothetical protein FGO68_gene3929 [Halteria grandinella]
MLGGLDVKDTDDLSGELGTAEGDHAIVSIEVVVAVVARIGFQLFPVICLAQIKGDVSLLQLAEQQLIHHCYLGRIILEDRWCSVRDVSLLVEIKFTISHSEPIDEGFVQLSHQLTCLCVLRSIQLIKARFVDVRTHFVAESLQIHERPYIAHFRSLNREVVLRVGRGCKFKEGLRFAVGGGIKGKWRGCRLGLGRVED